MNLSEKNSLATAEFFGVAIQHSHLTLEGSNSSNLKHTILVKKVNLNLYHRSGMSTSMGAVHVEFKDLRVLCPLGEAIPAFLFPKISPPRILTSKQTLPA